MKKSCCCSCFPCFSGSNNTSVDVDVDTRNPSATQNPPSAVVDTKPASPAVPTETVATRQDPQTPPSTSGAPVKKKIIEPSFSSSTSGASSSASVDDKAGESSSSSPRGMPSSSSVAAVPEGDSVEFDLQGFIDDLSQRLELIKEGKQKSSQTKRGPPQYSPPDAKTVLKLREFFSEGINVVKDVIPGDSIKTAVSGFLRGMGSAHLFTTGLLAIAFVLDRLEEAAANKTECHRLLKQMLHLAKIVKQYKERPQMKAGMDAEIKKEMDAVIEAAVGLIVEGSTMCYNQIDSSKFSRFFKAPVDKDDLDKFGRDIDDMYMQINTQMLTCLLATNAPKKAALSRIYPDHTFGIEEPVKELIHLLEWESKKNALAIMLHGFGGTGKTTLADAVFSLLNFQGWKYSKIQLFENIDSSPKIVELQRMILKHLMEPGEMVPDISDHQEGQRVLGSMLEKGPTFIYIDNVLGYDALGQLMPKDFNKSKKVRLLLTARDQNDVHRALKVETIVYAMKDLPETAAIHLLDKQIYYNENEKEKLIDATKLKKIVQSYGGIPGLLEVVGGFISAERDKLKAYEILMKEKEKWDTEIGKIDSYLFVYTYLPDTLKDPFLDICSFFKEWDWDTVADIVGEIELNLLRNRALVTKGRNGVVRVHDVILSIGLQKAKEMRFGFTNATQIKELLEDMDEKEIPEIKGIWQLTESNKDLLDILASNLDLMHSSLRVLALGNFLKVKDKCSKTFKELVFFQAAIPCLPFDVSKSKKLRYLKYKPEDLNFLEIPSSLRQMEFDGSLHSHAFEISSVDLQQLPDLSILRLIHFQGLKKLPEDLGDLVDGLRELSLSYCSSVEELPGSISKIQSLRVISLEHCSSLRELPEDFGSLSSLQELNLQGCSNLKALPNSFGKLTALRLLNVSFCEGLLDLPHGLENLTLLAELDLKNCSQLRSIPESVVQMKWLDFKMDMSGCSSLKELPNGICNLSFITDLSLSKCSNLEKLPDRFGELVSLILLNLEECTSLTKLPEGFGQLKYLNFLSLSGCESLEELCDDFHCLEFLKILRLSRCPSLKRLPEDFHRLPSLGLLLLSYCPMLDGRWMDDVVKLKSLQNVFIQGSEMLLRRWGEIKREGIDPSWSKFAVHTGDQDWSKGWSKDERENIEKNVLSEFQSLLINSQGEPFRLSHHLRANPVLLVVFDSATDADFHNEDDFPWALFEDEIQTKFKMIYIGLHFNKLSIKVKATIVGHADILNSRVHEVFAKVLSTVDRQRLEESPTPFCYFQIVENEKGAEYPPRWKFWRNRDVEEFLLGNCRSYERLKQLAERSGESNIELLRELFATEKGKRTQIFQKVSNENSKPFGCGVEELKGKRIFLDIRPIGMCYDMRLGSLIQLYNTEKESFNLEVISIPLLQPGTTIRRDAFEQFSGDVPWLFLENPGVITRAVKYFLIKDCLPEQGPELWDEEDEITYKSIVMIIEPNGKIFTSNKPVLPLLDRWGSKVYPFTDQKIKDLKEEEDQKIKDLKEEEETQMQSMSTSEFLFKHLETVSQQVKEVMLQKKMMIYLFGGSASHEGLWMKGFKCLRNALIEFSDNIHIIYIPTFSFENTRKSKLTDTISVCYCPLKKSGMLQAEMEGMPLLNLSAHDAIRFLTRFHLLKKEMDEEDVNGTQLGRMIKLLSSFDRSLPWMILIDKDQKMVTENGIKIELLCASGEGDKTKEVMKLLIQGSQEERQLALVKLEQIID